jgi:hypothetical protein
MAQLDQLKSQLKKGHVYRRIELARLSKSVDRHIGELLKEGTLQKLSQGIYYFPKQNVFGKTSPDEKTLVRSFLKDDRFLLTSPNVYNCLGLGTSQLYNERTVYNHKRHGEFKLGNRKFRFRMTPYFPNKLTEEFLLVDLVNHIDSLAEDSSEVLKKVSAKLRSMDKKKLEHAVKEYGYEKTKKTFAQIM